LQINVIGFTEVLHRGGLLRPPDNRPNDAAGEQTGAVELEMVAQQMGDLEVPRDWLGVDRQRRAAHHHRVPPLLMCADDVIHVRKDPCRNAFDEQSLADHLELGKGFAAKVTRGPGQKPGKFHPAESVSHRRLDDAEHLTDPCLPAPDAVAGMRRGGEAVHQGPVEVEERTGLRARSTRSDLRDRIVCQRLRGHRAPAYFAV
jgi:hypothetical protein